MPAALHEATLERMYSAVERVKARLVRAVAALERAGIAYAVVGGHAVANHVTRVDDGAERFTKDVDILVRRADLPAIIFAMTDAGFEHAEILGVDTFFEPGIKPSQGVHLVFEGERIKPDHVAVSPTVAESEAAPEFRVVTLEALVRMKLDSNRDRDRAHIRDLIAVGLLDDTWPKRYPPPLADRLRYFFDHPEE